MNPPETDNIPEHKSVNLTGKALSGLAVVSAGSVFHFAVQLGVTAILARLVLPAEFGLIAAAGVVIDFCRLFVQIGVGPALVQRKGIDQSHLDGAFTMSIVFGFAVAAIVVLAAPLVASAFGMPGLTPILRVLAAGFVIQAPSVVASSVMYRQARFKTMTTISVISYLIGYACVGITLAFLGWGVWALVWATLTQMAILTVVVMIFGRVKARLSTHLGGTFQLLRFGGGHTVGLTATYFADNLDNIVVGRILGAQALGFYNRAFMFVAIPVQHVSSTLDRVLFPLLSRVQSEQERLGLAYKRCLSLIALFSLPITVLLVLLAPEIIRVVLGNSWDPVIAPFQILALATLPRISGKMARSMVKATGAVYRSAWRQAVYAPLVLVGTLVGSRWGLVGAATGVLLANIAAQFMALELSVKESGLSWGSVVRAHLNGAGIAAALLVVGWPLSSGLRLLGAGDLIILVSVGMLMLATAVALTFAWPSFFLGEDGRWVVSLLRRRLREA